jgi:hypothetical protein
MLVLQSFDQNGELCDEWTDVIQVSVGASSEIVTDEFVNGSFDIGVSVYQLVILSEGGIDEDAAYKHFEQLQRWISSQSVKKRECRWLIKQ